MSTSVQPVAGALEAHILLQEIAARNLANVATPGFKRNIAIVESEQDKNSTNPVPGVASVGVDFSQGELRPTHNPLDLAIQGEGFFTIAGPNGLLYTRDGRFALNENRILVTQLGRPVLGESGEIQIPEGDGPLTVSRDGVVRMGDQVVGRLKISAFENPRLLRQVGSCEFRDTGSAGPKDAADYTIHQGFVESSNVRPITELVRMVASLRDYEACARSLKSIGDTAEKLYRWAQS